MIIHLLMVNGEKNEFVVLSGKDEYLLGREEGDLILGDERASRRHAKLSLGSDGRVKLVDLKSTNGTILNKEKVSEAVLSPEDVFRIGRTIFIFFGAQAENAGEKVPAKVERNRIDVKNRPSHEKSQLSERGKLGSMLLTGWPNNFRALKVEALSNFVDHLDEDQKKSSKRLIAIAKNVEDREDDAA